MTRLGVFLDTINSSVQATAERTGSLLALSSQQSFCKVHVRSGASVAGDVDDRTCRERPPLGNDALARFFVTL